MITEMYTFFSLIYMYYVSSLIYLYQNLWYDDRVGHPDMLGFLFAKLIRHRFWREEANNAAQFPRSFVI